MVCATCVEWILGVCENGASLLGSDVYVRFLKGLSAAIREVISGHKIRLFVCETQFCFRGYDKMYLSYLNLCFMAHPLDRYHCERVISSSHSLLVLILYFESQNQFQLKCNAINTPVYIYMSLFCLNFWYIFYHLKKSRIKCLYGRCSLAINRIHILNEE